MSLKDLLKERDKRFFDELVDQSSGASDFLTALALSNFRKRGRAVELVPVQNRSIRLAIIGGSTLQPLADLVEHFTFTAVRCEVALFVGEFDGYIGEILDASSELYRFAPDHIVILPSESRCRYDGSLLDSASAQLEEASRQAHDLITLCDVAHRNSGASIILCNFRLLSEFDPGPSRSMSLGSDFSFKKNVNQALASERKPFIQICDIEYLSALLGVRSTYDPRAWFESKQPFSKDFLAPLSKEVANVIRLLKIPSRKVAVLDLDNTLWGGVIGDDGLDGIELGTTSPRGEAFRHFQSYLLSLSKRGILLAVCSKNEFETAQEPFRAHPEMLIGLGDIVAFKANWEPKSQNLQEIARDLNLGLDSLVFLDDNPAEISIVEQFAPAVKAICLGDDPSEFVRIVQDSRVFESIGVTSEDLMRVSQYKQEGERKQFLETQTDMDSYLSSLEMLSVVSRFSKEDVPRISQLINKSNQFNLTTRRRDEGQVLSIIDSPVHVGTTIRLADRFGDHGLICILISNVSDGVLEIDTWCMSCRVLKRQVEELTLNEIFKVAKQQGCHTVRGIYIPTEKNGMVRDHYPRFGFTQVSTEDGTVTYEFAVDSYEFHTTKIRQVEGAPVGAL